MQLQDGTSRFLLEPSQTLVHPTNYFDGSATSPGLGGRALVTPSEMGHHGANLGPTRANMGQLGAISGSTWGATWPDLGQLESNLGPTRDELGANLA